jgi:phytoene synthase
MTAGAQASAARAPSAGAPPTGAPAPPPPHGGWPGGDPGALMALANEENFPVASALLGGRVRAHLLAIYGFARLVDELGDTFGQAPEERLPALEWLEAELDRAFAGAAAHPLLQRLSRTVSECGLPREPFARLIEANRADQRVARYGTWEELLGYCSLSADPVGELVLGVLGVATPERVALSDRICTALQLAEHWQDVAEDRARGRVYLPAEDMARFGVAESDLDAERAGGALRELIAFEVARARALLIDGLPLLATLRGRARAAVAAYAGGGLAALDAIEAAGFDVLAGAPRAGRGRRAAASARALALARGAAGEGAGARRECEAITRREARNFYWGIRLLPPGKRSAICAVYAFARRVDDIGDGPLPGPEKLRRLEALEADVRALIDGSPRTPDPVLDGLAAARERFPLPADALTELIEGVRMDLRGEHYERFEDLLVYCRRVAGGIGRLCLAVFGTRDERAQAWAPAAADELGVAMQLTNILRDVREDAERGRVYLPREDLARFGLGERLPEQAGGELEALLRFEAARAREWFGRGEALLEQLDRRSAACVLAMTGIYSRLLDRIAEQPAIVYGERLALSPAEKLRVSAASLLGVGA